MEAIRERPAQAADYLGFKEWAVRFFGSPWLYHKTRTQQSYCGVIRVAQDALDEGNGSSTQALKSFEIGAEIRNFSGNLLTALSWSDYSWMPDRAAAFEAEVARWTAAP